MFDAIIREIAEKFGIGNKAEQLLGGLLALVFNPAQGGFAGFMNKFKDAGLGDLASSWIGGGAGARTIEPDQVASVLGSGPIGAITSKLGLPQFAVTKGLAGVLPAVIGLLTKGGQIPTAVPSEANRLISGFNNWTDTRATPQRVADTASPGLGWLKWLVPLAALLALGYCMLNRQPVQREAPVAPAVDTSSSTGIRQDAAAALAALTGSFTGDDLVKALNQANIHFDTDSANISADSQDILATAAGVIQRAPTGTRVEIGGHTDNTGDPAANMTLSAARANAVRTRLVELGVGDGMLTAKGYGADSPKADNATDAGRAQNRRMEFTVVK